MYKDIEMKLNYYKEKIIKDFIKKGIYPDNSLIESKLNSIELRLSIFRKIIIKEGSNYDTNLINQTLNLIYDDFKILYELMYKLTVEEYNNLNHYIKSHIKELQETTDMYLKKAEAEAYATSLGKTILFKYNKFNMDKKNNISIINLGVISINQADKIICISKINNINYADVIFKLTQPDNILTSNLYNYNRDSMTIPGKNIIATYEYKFKDEQKFNGPIEIPIKPNNLEGTLYTLGGKDKILCKQMDDNYNITQEKTIFTDKLYFKTKAYIDFYVVNGTSISFRFNKKPISANFNINNNKIENLNHVHHFFMECDENFSFDFEIEKGSIYAIKEKTLLDRDGLFYSGNTDIKDFIVVQTLEGNSTQYEASIEIYNTNINIDDIESIIIKKI